MLFSSNSSNSFREDPPNTVLVTSDGQCAYEIIKVEVINNLIKMEMKALSDDLENISGRMSLFIDSIDLTVYIRNGIPLNDYKDDGLMPDVRDLVGAAFGKEVREKTTYNIITGRALTADGALGSDEARDYSSSSSYNVAGNRAPFGPVFAEGKS